MVKNLLKRNTASGNYYPEIDFVRFVTILAIAIYHSTGNHMVLYNQEVGHFFQFILNGFKNSVQVFFALSGYILSYLMFNVLGKNSNFNFKDYYKRRIRRVEPPFLIAVFLVYVLLIFTKDDFSINSLKHLFATLTYTHSLIYNFPSTVLFVTWTLELEVLFYLLAPFICLGIYKLNKRHKTLAYAMATLSIALFFAYRLISYDPLSALSNAPYFLMGLFIALVRYNGLKSFETKGINKIALNLLTLLFGLAIFFLDRKNFYHEVFLIIFMFIFLYLILHRNRDISLVKKEAFTIPGGMCYTIYLIHFPIISVVGSALKSSNLDIFANILLSTAIKLIVIFIASVAFYLLFEKPFMGSKLSYKAYLKQLIPNKQSK